MEGMRRDKGERRGKEGTKQKDGGRERGGIRGSFEEKRQIEKLLSPDCRKQADEHKNFPIFFCFVQCLMYLEKYSKYVPAG